MKKTRKQKLDTRPLDDSSLADVQGGLLLPAVQKSREIATR